MSSIFSRIISGEIPSYKIAENDKFFAFLDIMPLVPGHTLVVPKAETDKLFDMPADHLAEMLLFAQPIARAIEASFECKRCGIAVIGLEVPHALVHHGLDLVLDLPRSTPLLTSDRHQQPPLRYQL